MTARAMQTDDPATLTGSVEFDSGVITSDTQRVVLPTDQPAIPVKLSIAALDNGGTVLTPKFAKIGQHTSGDRTLVAAVSAKKILVLALYLSASGTVSVYFNNATDGAIFGDTTDTIDLIAQAGFVLPFSPVGWFHTGTVNEALRLNLSGNIRVSGGLVYVEI